MQEIERLVSPTSKPPRAPLQLRLRLDAHMAEFGPREAAVLQDLAQGLGVCPEQLSVLSVLAGSVVVTVAVAIRGRRVDEASSAARGLVGKLLGGLRALELHPWIPKIGLEVG